MKASLVVTLLILCASNLHAQQGFTTPQIGRTTPAITTVTFRFRNTPIPPFPATVQNTTSSRETPFNAQPTTSMVRNSPPPGQQQATTRRIPNTPNVGGQSTTTGFRGTPLATFRRQTPSLQVTTTTRTRPRTPRPAPQVITRPATPLRLTTAFATTTIVRPVTPFLPVPTNGGQGTPFLPVTTNGGQGTPFLPVPTNGGQGTPFLPVPTNGGQGTPGLTTTEQRTTPMVTVSTTTGRRPLTPDLTTTVRPFTPAATTSLDPFFTPFFTAQATTTNPLGTPSPPTPMLTTTTVSLPSTSPIVTVPTSSVSIPSVSPILSGSTSSVSVPSTSPIVTVPTSSVSLPSVSPIVSGSAPSVSASPVVNSATSPVSPVITGSPSTVSPPSASPVISVSTSTASPSLTSPVITTPVSSSSVSHNSHNSASPVSTSSTLPSTHNSNTPTTADTTTRTASTTQATMSRSSVSTTTPELTTTSATTTISSMSPSSSSSLGPTPRLSTTLLPTPRQPSTVVSTMIVFCNQYSATPLSSRDVSQTALLQGIRQQLADRCYCTSANSISSLTVAEDYASGRVVMQFLLETTSVPGAPFGAGNALAFLVNNRSMIVKVPAPGAIPPLLELNSNCEGANIFLWTDGGNCPDRSCNNGARCAKRGSLPNDFYCHCMSSDYTGRYCERRIEDLFPLIILPIFLGVLLLLLVLLCCCICCRGAGRQQIIEEVIHEAEEVESRRTVVEEVEGPRFDEPASKLPLQTYNHMIGRSFGVSFNDRSFLSLATATPAFDRHYYGQTGNRATTSAATVYSLPGVNRPRSALAGPITVTADVEPPRRDDYYGSAGRQKAMAFNRNAFNGRNTRSVIHNQPF